MSFTSRYSTGPSTSSAMPRCPSTWPWRSEEHTSELQSPCNLVCRLLLEKKKKLLELTPMFTIHLQQQGINIQRNSNILTRQTQTKSSPLESANSDHLEVVASDHKSSSNR